MQITDDQRNAAAEFIATSSLDEVSMIHLPKEKAVLIADALEAALAAQPPAKPIAWTSQKHIDQLREVHGSIVDMWNKGLLPPDKEIPLYAAQPKASEPVASDNAGLIGAALIASEQVASTRGVRIGGASAFRLIPTREAELEEALKFYADSSNWQGSFKAIAPHDGLFTIEHVESAVEKDAGNIARAALGSRT